MKSLENSVLVGGCFDLLHYGHIQFLKAAEALGDHLIVALEPDEKIIQTKKRSPIHTQQQRAEILASLKLVDEVILLPVLNRFEDYLDLVVQLKPAYIAITENDPQLANKQKQADFIGAKLMVVSPNIESFSSSKIIHEFS